MFFSQQHVSQRWRLIRGSQCDTLSAAAERRGAGRGPRLHVLANEVNAADPPLGEENNRSISFASVYH